MSSCSLASIESDRDSPSLRLNAGFRRKIKSSTFLFFYPRAVRHKFVEFCGLARPAMIPSCPLLLAASWISRSVKVKGVLSTIGEDHFGPRAGEGSHFKYTSLDLSWSSDPSMDQDATIFIVGHIGHTGASVELELDEIDPFFIRVPPGRDVDGIKDFEHLLPHAAQSITPPISPLIGTGGRRIFRAISPLSSDNGGDRRQRRFDAGPRSVVLIRVAFEDYAPAYCDEDCATDLMWGSDGASKHVSGMFAEASAGNTTFPKALGAVYTVNLSGMAVEQVACPFTAIDDAADAAMIDQHSVDVTQFVHQIYIIPTEIPGCTGWQGVAYVGCTAGACKSWLRTNVGATMAHELGHNLGLGHASTDSDDDGFQEAEYGDQSCTMGSVPAWRMPNAPHRLALGWIPEAYVLYLQSACTALPDSVRLLPLGVSASPNLGKFALKIARFGNRGGHYIISTRYRSGYESELGVGFINRVSLHYMPDSSEVNQNSQLVSTTGPGDKLEVKDSNTGTGFVATVELYSMNISDGFNITVDFCGFEEISTTSSFGEPICSEIVLSGRVGDNSVINGKYELSEDEHEGKALFFNPVTGIFVYWLPTWSLWGVGQTKGSSTLYAYLWESRDSPVGHSTSFKVVNNVGAWATDENVRIECSVAIGDSSSTVTVSTKATVMTPVTHITTSTTTTVPSLVVKTTTSGEVVEICNEYACTDRSNCIPREWLCDGVRDCSDGGDESKVTCARLSPDYSVADSSTPSTAEIVGIALSGVFVAIISAPVFAALARRSRKPFENTSLRASFSKDALDIQRMSVSRASLVSKLRQVLGGGWGLEQSDEEEIVGGSVGIPVAVEHFTRDILTEYATVFSETKTIKGSKEARTALYAIHDSGTGDENMCSDDMYADNVTNLSESVETTDFNHTSDDAVSFISVQKFTHRMSVESAANIVGGNN